MKIQSPESRIQEASRGSAFSLLEVMVATGILFTCTFAILQLVSQTLRNARALQVRDPNAGMLAAYDAMTNILTEGVESGNFKEISGYYPEYSWRRDAYQVGSNHLWEVDYTVFRNVRGRVTEVSHMSTLFYKPAAPEVAPRGELK